MQYERRVSNSNCVEFEGLKLQIPADQYRCHYVKVKVKVHKYLNGELSIFHGPRKLVNYDATGKRVIVSSAA